MSAFGNVQPVLLMFSLHYKYPPRPFLLDVPFVIIKLLALNTVYLHLEKFDEKKTILKIRSAVKVHTKFTTNDIYVFLMIRTYPEHIQIL